MCKKIKAEEEAKWPIYDMNLMRREKQKKSLKKGLEKELRNEFWVCIALELNAEKKLRIDWKAKIIWKTQVDGTETR